MHIQSAILCIDDEELALYLRKRVLQGAGYAVFIATNATRALELFKAQRFDLVITDNLQGVTGQALAAELRDLSPLLPIMVLSGGHTAAGRSGALRNRVDRESTTCDFRVTSA